MSTKTYVNNTGQTLIVRSEKYPKLELPVKPGHRVALDTAMECNIPDGLTAITT